MVITIVGMAGSGKSTFAEVCSAHGIPIVYFGGVVTREVGRRGLPLNQENEKAVREEFRAADGMAAIAKRVLPEILAAHEAGQDVALDGLYSWSELMLLKERLGYSLVTVAVHAPTALRLQRLAERPVRPLTISEVEARDRAEIENIEKGGPIAAADHVLLNDVPAAEFRSVCQAALFVLASKKIEITPGEALAGFRHLDSVLQRAFLLKAMQGGLAAGEDFYLSAWDHARQPETVALAVKALARLGSRDAFGRILGLCLAPDVPFPGGSLHRAAAWALGHAGAEAYPIALELTRNDRPETRLCGIDALGEIGDLRAAPILQRIMADTDDPAEAERAAAALGKLNPAMFY
jgi:dephospho-CoA kinase